MEASKEVNSSLPPFKTVRKRKAKILIDLSETE